MREPEEGFLSFELTLAPFFYRSDSSRESVALPCANCNDATRIMPVFHVQAKKNLNELIFLKSG